ncbi:polysaccharide pyruvyl transferase family protein [Desulforhabdus amnigena]|uniref:polysaccharide pyruvyl transferase family protein n=1 Tax=Desulforhabdus amnigena TaxID=40218 RepID=UPI00248FECE4|nr:polysaccharide pyruvyl transferase family protein [Desulforhabdus amnigena]
MNVGILTFHWAYNYGAALQAYALSQSVKKLGHTVQFIDYAPPALRLPWWQGWGFRSGTELLSRTCWRLRFDLFRYRCLPTTRRCCSKEELQATADEFDAVIVGSDQVWNGNITEGFDPTYFFDFVENPKCRKISYAACFGNSTQPAETISKAGALLNRFDFLSVRNEMSAKLVHDISGRKSEVVLDPTLLHDFGEHLSPPLNKTGYIAVYHLSGQHISIGEDILRIVKDKMRLPVILIGTKSNVKGIDRYIPSAGPVEWLRILQRASFVCTDSFHGTLFSIKFRKPFIVWSGFRPKRIRDFLTTCGLQDRLLTAPIESDVVRLINENIDYDAVEDRLSPKISTSLDFLKKALAS